MREKGFLQLQVHNTYSELNDEYLGAMENGTLETFLDAIKELVNNYSHHFNAILFLAKTQVALKDFNAARASYTKSLRVMDVKKIAPWNLKKTLGEIKYFAERNDFQELIIACDEIFHEQKISYYTKKEKLPRLETGTSRTGEENDKNQGKINKMLAEAQEFKKTKRTTIICL